MSMVLKQEKEISIICTMLIALFLIVKSVKNLQALEVKVKGPNEKMGLKLNRKNVKV